MIRCNSARPFTSVLLSATVILAASLPAVSHAEPPAVSQVGLPSVHDAEVQPLLLHVRRLAEAMESLGNPLPAQTTAKLDAAARAADESQVRRLIQEALDPLCLLRVHINPESRVKVDMGPARPELVEQGWRQFLVKVHNEAGVTAPLKAGSPQAAPVSNAPTLQQQQRALGRTIPVPIGPAEVRDRWLDMQLFNGRPLAPTLSGAKLEYRILHLYSRDAGQRSAVLSFDVGQGTQDIGFRNDVTLTFEAKPSQPLTFRVKDENGEPTLAGFTLTDPQGRVYPSQAKRLAPAFPSTAVTARRSVSRRARTPSSPSAGRNTCPRPGRLRWAINRRRSPSI